MDQGSRAAGSSCLEKVSHSQNVELVFYSAMFALDFRVEVGLLRKTYAFAVFVSDCKLTWLKNFLL